MLWGTGRFGAPSGSSYFATFVRYHWRVCLLLAALPLHIAFGGLTVFANASFFDIFEFNKN